MARRRPLGVRVKLLAKTLRALREERQLAITFVADKTHINETTVYRAEHPGKTVPNKSTVAKLLDFYGVTDQREQARLLALLRPANELPEVLHAYDADLDEVYRDYIALENDAATIANYESLYLPGLVQAPDYIYPAIRGSLPDLPDDQVRRLSRLRGDRQAALNREDGPSILAIVDEAALHRVVGGTEVMRAQLHHLLALPERVVLRVIPYTAGAHPGMAGSLAILTFRDPDLEDVAYVDALDGDRLHQDAANVQRYRRIFNQIEAAAASPEESARLVAEAVSAIE